MRRDPLLPAPWRPVAALSWLSSLVVLGALADHFRHSPGVDRPDAVLGSQVTVHLQAHAHLLAVATRLGSPAVVVGGSLVLALGCLALRRWRAAVFASTAAPLAGVLSDIVLKPLVHRVHYSSLLFPSGHTTGAFALALTVAVLVLPRADTRLLPAVARLLVGIAALAAASVTAVAVVALGWHYVTDAIGGVVTAVVAVVGVAGVVDAASYLVRPRAPRLEY
jgi:undecaprenyl-diphosphatase